MQSGLTSIRALPVSLTLPRQVSLLIRKVLVPSHFLLSGICHSKHTGSFECLPRPMDRFPHQYIFLYVVSGRQIKTHHRYLTLKQLVLFFLSHFSSVVKAVVPTKPHPHLSRDMFLYICLYYTDPMNTFECRWKYNLLKSLSILSLAHRFNCTQKGHLKTFIC